MITADTCSNIISVLLKFILIEDLTENSSVIIKPMRLQEVVHACYTESAESTLTESDGYFIKCWTNK
jgi:hypothetical protein